MPRFTFIRSDSAHTSPMKRHFLWSVVLMLHALCGFAANTSDTHPKADVLDLVFSENGAVSDIAANGKLYTGTVKPSTYYNTALQRWTARFTGEDACFYRTDYTPHMEEVLQNSFSFELMYKTYDLAETAPLSSQQYGGVGIEHIGGKICFLAHIGGDYQTVSAGTPIEKGVFYHVIGTYDKEKGELRLYVNGKREQALSVSGSLKLPDADTRWMGIGGDMNSHTGSTQYPLNGDIALARIYSEAITDEAALSLYRELPDTQTETSRPKADLIDVTFQPDGSVTNPANQTIAIETGNQAPAIHYNPIYGSYAAHFTGSDRCFYKIDYSRHTALQQAITNGFSIETMYQTNSVGTQTPFSSQQYGGFGLEQSNRLLQFYAFIDGNYVTLEADTPIEPGEIYHVVATYDKPKGEIRLYVNGKIEALAHVEGTLSVPEDPVSQWIGIGGDASSGSDFTQYPLQGDIFLARMYSTPLSDEEVASLYDFEEKQVTVPSGLYLIENAAQTTAKASPLRLNGLYRNNPGKLGCAGSAAIDLSQVWELVETDTPQTYILKNKATGHCMQSAATAACGQTGTPVKFYAYPNQTYAIECDGILYAEDGSVTNRYGDENSAAAWNLIAVDENMLETYASQTFEQVRTWYKQGDKYNQHAPNPRLETALEQQPTPDNCLALTQSLYVPATRRFKVLQYNTWNNGGMISGGPQGIIDAIEQTNPDILLLQEVRSQSFVDKVIAHFKEKGITYYGKSMNISTAILSKYPFESIRSSEELGADSYAYAKALVKIDNQEIALYSIHLDWKYLAYYYPRGFDGNSDTRPYAQIAPYTNEADVLAENRKSRRPEEVKALLADATKEIAQNRLVIFGGDFNEASHLDWQEDTKHLRDHNQLVINWDCSLLIQQSGMKDAYRTCHPNPVTHPGFTCNAGNKWANKADYNWSFGVDDRERIDLTYYYPHPDLKLTSATVIGPKEDFYDNQIHYEATEDPVFTPDCIWGSDHKAVLTEYEISVSAPMTYTDTRMEAGTYYLKAHKEATDTAYYIRPTADHTVAYLKGGPDTAPVQWTLTTTGETHTLGTACDGTQYYLNETGTLTSAPAYCTAYTYRQGVSGRTALAFRLDADFNGNYLVPAETLRVTAQQNPETLGEEQAFSFHFLRAASGITAEAVYPSVAFVDTEESPCAQYRADTVEWTSHFPAGQWRAVFLPARTTSIRQTATGFRLQPGTDIELMQYNARKQVFETYCPDPAEANLPQGAYLMRSLRPGYISITFPDVAFKEHEVPYNQLTGNGTAKAKTVSGYKLNSETATFVYATEITVSPFEAYICPDPATEPRPEIPVETPSAITGMPDTAIRLTVSGRQIHVTGTDRYTLFDAGGMELRKNALLQPGVYFVKICASQPARKVVVP